MTESKNMHVFTLISIFLVIFIVPLSNCQISNARCRSCRLRYAGRDVCGIYGPHAWDEDCNYIADEVFGPDTSDGSEYFEGDIKIDHDTLREHPIPDCARNAIGERCLSGWPLTHGHYERLWPKGIIPYTFHQYFGPRQRAIVRKAIRDIHKRTCVRFTPHQDEKDYIEFTSEKGCWSHLGRQGKYQMPQKLSLAGGCASFGVALHEIMHLLGFFHEQSRPDRDKYIRIMWNNVKRNQFHNFQKYEFDRSDHIDVGYDYNSIMHYPKNAWARLPWLETIRPIRPDGRDRTTKIKLGQRRSLSYKDVKEINLLYNCTQTPEGDWLSRDRSETQSSSSQNSESNQNREEYDSDRRSRDNERERDENTTTEEPTTTTTHAVTTIARSDEYDRKPVESECEDSDRYCQWVSPNFCDKFDCLKQQCKRTCKQCT